MTAVRDGVVPLQEIIAHREWLVSDGRALSARAQVVRKAAEVVRADAVAGLVEAASLMAECRALGRGRGQQRASRGREWGEWAKPTKPFSDGTPGKIACGLKYKTEAAAVVP